LAHSSSETTISSAERKFMDLMQHGDDFLKIELLRPAKNYYQRALELHPDKEEIKQKIADCDRLLAFERKVIWILVSIAAVIVLFYAIS